MSASKTRTGLVAFLSLLLGACGSLKSDFREEETFSPAFYAPALRDSCDGIQLKDAPADAIKKITVYKTSFREKLVETGSIINYASLNDKSKRDTVDYRPPRTGYHQDMYLVRVQATCHQEAWFYYSVWYRYDGKRKEVVPYGFGRAYMGSGHRIAGTIYFHSTVIVKEGASGYSLKRSGKGQFYFVLNDMTEDTLRVNRLVVEEKNKFGGPRSYVFRVADHFPNDMQTLNFIKQKEHRF